MKYFLIISIFCLTSCYNDIHNIRIQGIIKDSISKKPIQNVRVSIICWKYGNTPDGSYTGKDSVTIFTNKDGLYRYNFNKGAFIEIKTFSENYVNQHEIRDIIDKQNTIDINLRLKK